MKIKSLIALCCVILAVACKSPDQSDKNPTEQSCEITQTSFKDLKSKFDNAIILDVRSPEEIAEGKIPSAVEMDFFESDFNDKLKTLDNSRPVIIYCKSGGRAGKTCKRLHDLGFQHVFNYGGYERYLSEASNE